MSEFFPATTGRFLAIVIFSAVFSASLFADQGLVPTSSLDPDPLSGNTLVRVYRSDEEPVQFLQSSIARDRIERIAENFNITIGSEVLKHIDLPSEDLEDPEDLLRRAYNQLMAISTMEGIEYYSHSRETMRLLFELSHRVQNRDSKDPVPDLYFRSRLPATRTIYVRQKDLTFGDNHYSITYHREDGLVWAEMTNLNQLWYGIIPVIGPGSVKFIFALAPSDEGLYFYAHALVDVFTLLGMEERAGNSFSSRIEALSQWFSSSFTAGER